MKFKLKKTLNKLKLFYVFKLLTSLFVQLASLFLIYLLTPSEYGYLALIISVAQLMYIFTSGWTNGALINLGTKKFAETGNYNSVVYHRTIIVLIAFIIISVLFFLLKIPISEFILLKENYILVFVLFIGYVLYDYASQLLYPGNKDLIQSSIDLTATLSLFLITVLFVRNIVNYIYLYTSIYVVFTIIIISIFIFFYAKYSFKWNKIEFTYLFTYSLWQFLSVISIYVINIGVNYLFIYYDIKIDDIGLYNFSYKLFSGFAAFFGLFGILIPKWVHNTPKEKLHKLLKTRIFYSVVILSLIYLFIGIILKPFIIFINKVDYLNSVNYFMFLFPAFILMCYGNLINTIIMNTSHYKKAQFAIVAQGLSLIISSFFLVGRFGIYGAIISTTISFIIGAIYLYLLYTRKVKQDFLLEKEW